MATTLENNPLVGANIMRVIGLARPSLRVIHKDASLADVDYAIAGFFWGEELDKAEESIRLKLRENDLVPGSELILQEVTLDTLTDGLDGSDSRVGQDPATGLVLADILGISAMLGSTSAIIIR